MATRLVLPWPRVRILLDYRPALRERTGVGEYVHELAAALDRQRPADDTLTLFSSSWKDRLTSVRLSRARASSTRVCRCGFSISRGTGLNFRRSSGSSARWTSRTPLQPLLIPTRAGRPGRDDSRPRLSGSPRAHAQRDSPRLRRRLPRGMRAAPTRLSLCRASPPKKSSRGWRASANASPCARPAHPAGRPRPSAEADGPILFMGTLEPRKNVGALLGAYAPPALHAADRPEAACSRAARRPPRRRGSTPSRSRRSRVMSNTSATSHPSSATTSTPRHRCWSCPPIVEGFGLPVLEAMTVGVPVIVSRARRVARGGRRRGRRGRTGRSCRRWPRRCACSSTDPGRPRRASERGRARARQYSWDTSATALYGAYRDAIGRRRGREDEAGVLTIGVDARELLGETTGTGRYLESSRADGQSTGTRTRQFLAVSPRSCPSSRRWDPTRRFAR